MSTIQGTEQKRKCRDKHGSWATDTVSEYFDGDHVEPPNLELRSSRDMAVSRKIISEDPNMLNPVLWRTLPKDLLLLVFARLPVPDITRLRSLSKEWYKDMATVNSEINQACDENGPIMVAGVSRLGHSQYSQYDDISRISNPGFHVVICTQRSHSSYDLRLGDPNPRKHRWDQMGARDDGLGCFVSTWKPSKANPLCVVVVNLLTRVQHELPPLQYVYSTPPKMMHIEVDSKTKCYRVVVVGKHVEGRLTVEMYDSSARQWTKATTALGFIVGHTHEWGYIGNGYDGTFLCTSIIWSVCDLAKGELVLCGLRGPLRGASVLKCVFQKDCMFLLHKNTSKGENLPMGGYCITKYRLQSSLMDWIQERSYLCPPIEALSETECCWMTLSACKGFLLWVLPYGLVSECHSWLLDLSTEEWSSLPNSFGKEPNLGLFMTRASWNVVP